MMSLQSSNFLISDSYLYSHEPFSISQYVPLDSKEPELEEVMKGNLETYQVLM